MWSSCKVSSLRVRSPNIATESAIFCHLFGFGQTFWYLELRTLRETFISDGFVTIWNCFTYPTTPPSLDVEIAIFENTFCWGVIGWVRQFQIVTKSPEINVSRSMRSSRYQKVCSNPKSQGDVSIWKPQISAKTGHLRRLMATFCRDVRWMDS